jgi:hypothetical protein
VFCNAPNNRKMKTLTLTLLAALGLAMTAIGAQAQDQTTRYSYDRNGNCTYSNYGGYETFYTYDGHGNLTYQYSTGEYPQPTRPKAVVAPTPLPAATNPSHPTRSTIPVPTPAVVTQAPVTVVEGTLTPEEIQALVNGK